MLGRKVKIAVGKEGQIGHLFEDFTATFEITKMLSDLNTCHLQIYNPNEISRTAILQTDNVVEVTAGYEDETQEIIFIGNVTKAFMTYIDSDVIGHIEAEDGQKEITKARTVVSFTEGTSINTIFKTILDKIPLGLRKKFNLLNIPKKQFPNAFSFMGTASSALNQICKSVGLQWSIQNKEIKIWSAEGNDGSLAIDVRQDTGLLDSPERITIKRTVQGVETKVDGWKVRSLLQPFAESGGRIILTSKEIDKSPFTIDKVIHSGHSEQSDFVTLMEVYE